MAKLIRRKVQGSIPVKDLTIQMVIPAKALRSIDLDGTWKGKVSVEIDGPPAGRLAKISLLRADAATKKEHSLTPEMHALADLWNSRVDPPPYEPRDRNRMWKKSNITDNRREFQRITNIFSYEKLSADMQKYFETCVTGEYTINGRDVRYKTLSGWVKALLKARKNNETCWWENRDNANAGARAPARAYAREADPFPETTELVANTYARLILKTDSYGAVDQGWLHFQKVASRVERIMLADIEIDKSVLVKMVMRSAEKQQEGFPGSNIVYPGNLTTTTLWKVVLPQFIEDHMPGIKLPMEEENE